ncbi:MAG: GNAT family N-acetyltransferase [Candidatus Obscuribacterales bacterium]|nr:GNAT family N-acetyltransferase [Candidatus Obscuribacterales bacterium]
MTEAEFLIKELAPADAEEFWKLRLKGLKEEAHAFGASYEESLNTDMDTVRKRVSSTQNSFVLAAVIADKFVGVTGFYRYQEGIKSAHKGVLWGVYLLPEHRGRGIAKVLLKAVIEKARSLPGIELIHLGVNPANQPVVKLYESLGFSKWGTERHALKVNGEYVDEDQMVLWL